MVIYFCIPDFLVQGLIRVIEHTYQQKDSFFF
jgi:hypothetical protein